MTKIGEESDWPNVPGIERAHKEIDQSTDKFVTALKMYQVDSSSNEEKQHLRVVMDQQLELIRSAVTELKRSGIYNQELKVEKDYEKYLNNSSIENFAALEQDLQTLKEYNQLP